MQFQPLSLNEIPKFRKCFNSVISHTCDYTVGGMFMWRRYYKMEFAEEKGFLFSRLTDEKGRFFYNLPLGGELSDGLEILFEQLKEDGEISLRFCTIPEKYADIVSQRLISPKINEQEDFSDYFYSAEDIKELRGKKYSGQRNLIKQFERSVLSYSFEEITAENLGEAVVLFERLSSSVADSDFAAEENFMVSDVLANYDLYGMSGGLLRADGEVVGFSLGETVNDTLFVHIERADRSVKGSHQMLVNSFAKHFAVDGIIYINREEDMGNLGLRSAKKAYNPISLLKKYTVEGIIR